VNEWLVAAAVLLTAMLPLLWVCHRGNVRDALAALTTAQMVAVVVVLLLCQGFGRPAFYPLAEVLALLATGGVMAFARFLERWV
jgi:multisubunit Na+/H+ antiporter MnhF subunit